MWRSLSFTDCLAPFLIHFSTTVLKDLGTKKKMDRSSRRGNSFRKGSEMARSSNSDGPPSLLMAKRRGTTNISADIDNYVVHLLLEKFQTEVSPEQQRKALVECAAEVRSLLVFAPRLFRFSHRTLFSLRHPFMSYTTWAHQVESGPVRRVYAETDRGTVLDTTNADRWAVVADVHDTIIKTGEEDLKPAVDRLEADPGLQDIIVRFWNRLVPVIREECMKPGVTMSAAAYMYLHAKMADCLFPTEPLIVVDLIDDLEADLRMDATLSATSTGAVDGGDGERSELSVSRSSSRSNSQSATYDLAPISQLTTLGSNDNKQYRNLRGMPSIKFEQFKRSLLELADNWTTSCHPMEFAAFLWDLYSKIFADDWAAEADATITKSSRAKNGGFDALQPEVVPRRRERVLGGAASVARRLGNEMMAGEDITQVYTEEEIEALPMDVRQGLLEVQIQEANKAFAVKQERSGKKKRQTSATSERSGRTRSPREEVPLRNLVGPPGTKMLQSKLMTLTCHEALNTVLQDAVAQNPVHLHFPMVHYKK